MQGEPHGPQKPHGDAAGASANVLARNVFLTTLVSAIVTMATVLFFVLGTNKGITWSLESLLPAGSTYARDIDFVIILVAILTGFWFFASLGTFFWLIWRFRARDGVKAEYLATHEHMLERWVSWPHILIILCDIVIIAAAVRVWVNVKQTLPPPQATVRVIGQQWAWTFVHPGPDNKLDTADDVSKVDELHVKADTLYHYELLAKDVLHSFSVPVFRLKQDAVPGRVIKGWFKPTLLGSFDIQCAEMCGVGHGLMGARIFVETEEQHAAWLASQQQVAGH